MKFHTNSDHSYVFITKHNDKASVKRYDGKNQYLLGDLQKSV